jgi:predicted house-cleaning noncanonical NTP pyrophosphatase (MazG superfamily)
MIDKSDFEKMAWNICCWHIATFPKATVESQILKINEEICEYNEAENFVELADVFIASAAAAKRFNNPMAKIIMNTVIEDTFENKTQGILFDAIVHKMKINKTRKWSELSNGINKHINDNMEKYNA